MHRRRHAPQAVSTDTNITVHTKTLRTSTSRFLLGIRSRTSTLRQLIELAIGAELRGRSRGEIEAAFLRKMFSFVFSFPPGGRQKKKARPSWQPPPPPPQLKFLVLSSLVLPGQPPVVQGRSPPAPSHPPAALMVGLGFLLDPPPPPPKPPTKKITTRESFLTQLASCLRSSRRATVSRCTSSGPSARRSVRMWAYIDDSPKSSPIPAAPCAWMAWSMISSAICGTATLMPEISVRAALLPSLSISHAV